ncbi:hypothetical protein MMC10_008050 [Thelotrema lepadinum]|nr:hypothetical protein [Thelotrema lepadinum]
MPKFAAQILDKSLGSRELLADGPSRFMELLPVADFSLIRDDVPLTVAKDGKGDDRMLIEIGSKEFRAFDLPLSSQHFSHERTPDGDVCLTCEDIEIRTLLSNGGGKQYQIGQYRDVANCRSCGLCSLLTAAFEADTDLSDLHSSNVDAECFVILEARGTLTPTPSTRRERAYELYGMLLDGYTRQLHATARIRPLATSATLLGRSPIFHARTVNVATADLRLARTWIDECYNKHGHVEHLLDKRRELSIGWGSMYLQDSSDGMSQRDQGKGDHNTLRLVDVKKRQLVFRPWNERYIALSYVWPRFETLRLLKSNTVKLHSRDALLKSSPKLSRVIGDAMDVVLELGQRYLWVDALCITQDDELEKISLINAMDRIYGGSVLTLVVAKEEPPVRDYGIAGINGTPRRIKQRFADIENVQLVTALADVHSVLKRTVWSTRGWTFQEMLLSQRCLIMSDDQMFFRCPHDYRTEDVQAEESEGYIRHPAKPEFREAQMDYLMGGVFLERVSADDTFHEYSLLVQGYTPRSFTDPTDILYGFTGIMNTMFAYFPLSQAFFVGMPCHAFDRALLWYPTSHLKRREAVKIGGNSLARLPTWSWAGWRGSVGYEKDTAQLGDLNTQKSMVMWFRSDDNQLIPIRNYRNYSADALELSHCMLAARARSLTPLHLIFWGTCVELSVSSSESHISKWMSKKEQTLPCFALLDSDDDPCGVLPSADREWAARHIANRHPPLYQFLLLSYASQSRFDQIHARAKWLDPKFSVPMPGDQSPVYICFYNIMLVEFDEEGIAYRRGVGRVHKDAVDRNLKITDRKIMILG